MSDKRISKHSLFRLKITVGCPLCTYPSIHFSLDEDMVVCLCVHVVLCVSLFLHVSFSFFFFFSFLFSPLSSLSSSLSLSFTAHTETKSTRQVTPPIKNGHTRSTESRESYQSVNPCYVTTWEVLACWVKLSHKLHSWWCPSVHA